MPCLYTTSIETHAQSCKVDALVRRPTRVLTLFLALVASLDTDCIDNELSLLFLFLLLFLLLFLVFFLFFPCFFLFFLLFLVVLWLFSDNLD